jgi:Cu+-exporting ATPase
MAISNGLEEVRLPIEGMECAACAVRLERQLGRPDSVDSASVNYATSEATVAFDSGQTSVNDLVAIVQKSGFEVADLDSDAEGDVLHRAVVRARGRFIFSALLTAPVFFLSMFGGSFQIPNIQWVLLFLSAPVVLFAGAPFFADAFKALKAGSANMNTLISIGVSASFLYSLVATIAPELLTGGDADVHVYYEAAAVITTLVLLGRMLEARAKARTDVAVRELIELQPDVALVVRNGNESVVRIADVQLCDVIVLKPGSRVPVDGRVLTGETDIDESMLTGEPMPVEKRPNSLVAAGTMNLTGSVTFEATRVGADTALQRIIQLVRSAQGKKPPIQRLADKVSSVFVPTILAISLVTFSIWMLYGPDPPLRFAILTAVSVLIIACPCALGLATPTAVLVGIGRAASAGIFIKGGGALERLDKIDAVVLDKTGTVTEGAPEVISVVPHKQDEASLLTTAASLERRSEHPIARAICAFVDDRGLSLDQPDSFAAHAGGGVIGILNGGRVTIGNARFVVSALSNASVAPELEGQLATLGPASPGASVVFVTVDDQLAGSIQIADRIRDTSRAAIARLHDMKIQVVMATGDTEESARHIGKLVGLNDIRSDLSPADKVSVVNGLRSAGRTVAVVGDGINDAPALAAADVGLAIGTGTDVALETADVGLVRDDLHSVVDAIQTARMTMRVIRQNLFFAFIYNVVGIPIAAGILFPALGILLNPMIASAAMAMSSVSVVTNSLRLKRKAL